MPTTPRGDAAAAVRGEYARLAPDYDRRWGRYVRESTDLVLESLPLRPGLRLLDVGCGTGYLLERALAREGDLCAVGADLTPEMLSAARLRLDARACLVQAEAGRLPFRDGSFDAAVSASSMHYWPDPEAGVAEIVRVLRPGGALVLVDWNADSAAMRLLAWALRRSRGTVGRLFHRREIEALAGGRGLAEIRVSTHAIDGIWRMYRLVAVRRDA